MKTILKFLISLNIILIPLGLYMIFNTKINSGIFVFIVNTICLAMNIYHYKKI